MWPSSLRKLSAGVLLTLALAVGGEAQAGKLDDAGERTRGSPNDDRAADSSDDLEEDDDDDFGEEDEDESSDCGEFCEAFVRWMLGAPWTVPYELLREEPSPHFAYARYPYQGGPGYLRAWVPGEAPQPPDFEVYPRSPSHPTSPPSGTRTWALTTALEAGSNFSGVRQAGATARLFTPLPLELEARFYYFVEQSTVTDAEQNVKPESDWASLSNLNLSFRFAATRSVQFRTGIGYQHWFEDQESQSEEALTVAERHRPGFQFHYGFDAYPGRPVTLSGEARVGNLGAALVLEARGTLGAALGPVELFGGYQALNIGGIGLGGPLVGVRGYW